MKEIRMVDLVTQYEGIQEEVDKSVLDVIRSSAYINGPEVKSFQAELEDYLGVKHVIPCANGTDALQIAMMGLGLKPGDEVITATFTFVATAEVIALLQLTPVLVDVDPDTFLIDPAAIEAAITPKTKAIVPVHLFGQVANMDEIQRIAKAHDLFVIEDNAQAIGASFTNKDGVSAKAGTIGHVGCTSFFPSKNLGCMGDGGAIFTNDDDLASKMRMIVNHGMVRQYYHDHIGVNSRLDSIQAAVLRIKLRKLDVYNSARNAAAAAYDTAFANCEDLETPARAENSTHVFHQYTLKVKNGKRDELRAYLGEKGIPSMIYYPVPLHMQEAYKDERYGVGHFPITESLVDEVLSLPMHTELDKEQLDFITSSVLEYINR
ncbi:DegT/DnrJ/EryC1/StrS family aminotransferase [Phaeocystidibacter marisrubri]|uniref:DegT/DnrJ/EryC1/StrS family aminotransferase n=1 Tax=Phaeocystidibacter marisrubri TaxID=1577780 RepID=A0A6L3ZDL9_9FLAO|nr:DegT/DnrJ/EryC1/StrS family aminotransferase [Phaeocystidibacter marisrubri]KAB2815921.1 DegT/DnrJ/EryC1/StrS family aminotransferase [Phaeocystidibacter marisrubri]GGH66400.1 cell surface polysaccharide biosynthesis protein [Phaeocystidibacter marisrubri]